MEYLELLHVVRHLHRVRAQVAQLQLAEVAQEVPEGHVELAVVAVGEPELLPHVRGDGLPVAVAVAPLAAPLAVVAVRVADADQRDAAADARAADLHYLFPEKSTKIEEITSSHQNYTLVMV